MKSKNTFKIILGSLFMISILFIQCSKTDDHGHTHDESTHELDNSHANGIGHRHLNVSPEIIKQWGIKYSEVKERDFIESITLTGVVKENRETTYFVNSLVSGVVIAIKKDIGDIVKKGEVLCVLNSPELLELKTNYIKSFQDYRLNKENFERAKKLFEIKGIEKKEFIKRESAYKTAMAEYFSLESALKSICFDAQTLKLIEGGTQWDKVDHLKEFLSPYYNILSPGSGKVIMRDLRLGERVEMSKTVFEVSNTKKMWVILDVLEKDLPYVEKGKSVQIETDVFPGRFFNGRILTLMQKIDPELRTLKVRIEVDNEKGYLKPEMYVRGKIDKKIHRQKLAVPVNGLVKLSGVDGVFIIEEGEFVFKPVQVIETDSAGYVFLNGLKPGDLVITEGAFYLKAEYEIQSGKADPHAGHSH